MKKIFSIVCVFIFAVTLVLVSCDDNGGGGGGEYDPIDFPDPYKDDGKALFDSNKPLPLILVHYMPWYEGPQSKSQEGSKNSYGGHWTSWGKIDPTKILADGRSEIFSLHYPLTGPYHSSSTALLEYQASLMIIAGIDGAIFDWYGTYDANDFALIHTHTTNMVNVLKKAGLKYLVCYEDNTINMMSEAAKGGKTEIEIGKTSFDFLQNNWFKDSGYVKYETKPVVLCFGPQYFTTQEQWDAVFAGTNPKPLFVDLENRNDWFGSYTPDATFNWPPVEKGKVSTQADVTARLNAFSNKNASTSYKVASVFPAFEDAYEESFGEIPYGKGEFFDLSFRWAVEYDPNIVQIVTWNDFGEGAIIEPTIERGYRELEYLQAKIKLWHTAQEKNFPFTAEDLRWPLEIYRLRYTQKATAAQKDAMDAATNALFNGNVTEFRAQIEVLKETGISVDINDLKPILRD